MLHTPPCVGKTMVLEHTSLLYSKVTGYNIDKIVAVVDKVLHGGIGYILDRWEILKIRPQK